LKIDVDLIHLGYPKTGTTWVQDVLFANLSGLKNIGKPYDVNEVFIKLFNQIVSESSLTFSVEQYKIEILQALKARGIEPKSKTTISFELFSGDLYSGFGATRTLERIHAIFNPATVLITIREQTAVIESLYKFYVAGGGSLTIQDFLYHRNSPGVDYFGNLNLVSKFMYDVYIKKCIKIFGKEKVLVVPFEKLIQCPTEFITNILAPLGLADEFDDISLVSNKKRGGISYLGTGIWRRLNQIFATNDSDSTLFGPYRVLFPHIRRTYFFPLDKHVFSKGFRERRFVNLKRYYLWERLGLRFSQDARRLTRNITIKEDLKMIYKESNLRSQHLTGIPLEKYGYSLPQKDEIKK